MGKVNPPFDKFLFAVAQAEGMTSDGSAGVGEEDKDQNEEEVKGVNAPAVVDDDGATAEDEQQQ